MLDALSPRGLAAMFGMFLAPRPTWAPRPIEFAPRDTDRLAFRRDASRARELVVLPQVHHHVAMAISLITAPVPASGSASAEVVRGARIPAMLAELEAARELLRGNDEARGLVAALDDFLVRAQADGYWVKQDSRPGEPFRGRVLYHDDLVRALREVLDQVEAFVGSR